MPIIRVNIEEHVDKNTGLRKVHKIAAGIIYSTTFHPLALPTGSDNPSPYNLLPA